MSENSVLPVPLRTAFSVLLPISISVVLAACGSTDWSVPLVDADPRVADTEQVFVTTMRAPSPKPGERFSSVRDNKLHFVDVEVSVPKKRKIGKIAGPQEPPDPSKQFAATDITEFEGEGAFLAALNSEMTKRPHDERVAFVFVHGYNNKFGESVYRHAQLRRDYQVRAVPIHYSWPSAGNLDGYLYDRDSVQFARDGLLRTLELIQRSKANRIFLVGHSMGSLLVMETLRQASISGRKSLLRSIQSVVLAAPDIDQQVFEKQIDRIDPMPQPFVIFVSSRDQALRASRVVRRGRARVGEGRDIPSLQAMGITVVDLSGITDGDLMRHGVFASSPTLINIIDDQGLNLSMLGQSGQTERRSEAARRFDDNVVFFPTPRKED